MTKLVLVSDLHGQPKTLNYLQKIIDKHHPDGVVISGDITTGNDISFFEELESLMDKKHIKGYVIWGNSDLPYANSYIAKSKYCIHLKSKKIGSYNIFGISEIEEPISTPKEVKGSILVTHKPPAKVLLKNKYKNAPEFHISGHIHSLQTAKQYPATFHISVPTLQDMRFALFTPENKKVIFSKISQ